MLCVITASATFCSSWGRTFSAVARVSGRSSVSCATREGTAIHGATSPPRSTTCRQANRQATHQSTLRTPSQPLCPLVSTSYMFTHLGRHMLPRSHMNQNTVLTKHPACMLGCNQANTAAAGISDGQPLHTSMSSKAFLRVTAAS